MILIVDDDPSVGASLALLLKRRGHAVRGAASPAEALVALADADAEPCELVLQDMNFSRETSGGEGLALLAQIRARHPALPVILITAWGSIALAVEGVKAGAADFITKPWNNAQLLQSVDTALSLAAARRDEKAGKGAPADREELDRRLDLGGLVGRDPRFLKLLELVGRVASTDASILITGESGTGKELVAAALHANSRRRGRPFVKVNLGGISSTLFESEMFGHVRGAFTDARVDRKGRFEMAAGGTIFLDEIGEVDPSAQVKLLRVLQDRSYEVLGSSIARTVDVRVVSATHRDLGERVAAGQFREDLLYRLNLIVLRLPPLRERRGDIPLLARHFLDTAAAVYRPASGSGAIALSDRAAGWLTAQDWPGNIRQLRQTIERAVLILDHDRLEVEDLLALSELASREAPGTALPSPGSMTLDQMEKAMIEKCLTHFEGNLTRVSEALGLSRAALYRRLEKYGIGA
jgi:two-component system NtrC family response regulator